MSFYPEKIRSLPIQKGKVDTSSKFILEANNCKVLFASYEPGTRIAPHKHDDADIHGVVIKGEIILTINGKTNKHVAGDWYHIPPGAKHATLFEQQTDEIEYWFTV
ncbi:MAG: cupin domain-containing protein [Pseudomonadales bacterium]|nr:cupin domain-containing protein [Pseudomonadales bacterium]